MIATSPEDAIVEAVTRAMQATVGPLATAHPWAAGGALMFIPVIMLLGLVSGYIKPESLTTPRRRAGARIALRFGMAAKGSGADAKAFITNVDPPSEETPHPDPLAVAAGSLPGQPPPAALLDRVRPLAPAPATVAATTPHPPGEPVPREEPSTDPPPPMRPRSRSSADEMPTSREVPSRSRQRSRP